MQNVKEDLVIVGLGNPGPRYKETLHNVGFKIVEKIAESQVWPWKYESRFQAEVSKGKLGLKTFHLLRPETFMNLSGESVQAYLAYYGLAAENVIVVADDADLLKGEIRLRSFGGSGGHNGLKSVEQKLLTQKFKRLRFGIGRPHVPEMSLADFVLMVMPQEFWEGLNPDLDRAAKCLEMLADSPFEAVMKAANTK